MLYLGVRPICDKSCYTYWFHVLYDGFTCCFMVLQEQSSPYKSISEIPKAFCKQTSFLGVVEGINIFNGSHFQISMGVSYCFLISSLLMGTLLVSFSTPLITSFHGLRRGVDKSHNCKAYTNPCFDFTFISALQISLCTPCFQLLLYIWSLILRIITHVLQNCLGIHNSSAQA